MITCPGCGAVQNPSQGDLSLTCGSTLAEVRFAPDPQHLESQSDECKITMLTRQRDEWRTMARRLANMLTNLRQASHVDETRRRAALVLADYKVMEAAAVKAK